MKFPALFCVFKSASHLGRGARFSAAFILTISNHGSGEYAVIHELSKNTQKLGKRRGMRGSGNISQKNAGIKRLALRLPAGSGYEYREYRRIVRGARTRKKHAAA